MTPESRFDLHRQLAEALGQEAADALMETLPPVPWKELATKSDLRHLEDRLNLRFEAVDLKLEALEHRLTAAFRGELTVAITTQTRTLVLANLGSLVALGSFMIAAAKVL